MNVIRATMMTNRRAAVRICVAGYAEDDGSDPAVPSASGVCVSSVSAAGSLKRFDTLLLWVHLKVHGRLPWGKLRKFTTILPQTNRKI